MRVANLGDSRAVHLDHTGAVLAATQDHKPGRRGPRLPSAAEGAGVLLARSQGAARSLQASQVDFVPTSDASAEESLLSFASALLASPGLPAAWQHDVDLLVYCVMKSLSFQSAAEREHSSAWD